MYRAEKSHRVGVALSMRRGLPAVTNVALDGLGRGRLRMGDKIVAINGVSPRDVSEANQLLRETVGEITIRIIRRNAHMTHDDDMTEIMDSHSNWDSDSDRESESGTRLEDVLCNISDAETGDR